MAVENQPPATLDWSAEAATCARTYHELLVPVLFAPFAEDLLDAAGVEPGIAGLDVACGTGAVTRPLARRIGSGGTVVAIDVAEPMLAIARGHRAEPGSALIEYLAADATQLDVSRGRFDLVVCQQGLQFFDDRAAALETMRRALGPGGKVAIASWTDHHRTIAYAALADALAAYIDEDAGATMRSPWALDDGAELYRLLDAAGFATVSVRSHTRLVHFDTREDIAREMVTATPLATRFTAAPRETQERIADYVLHAIDGVAGGPDAVEYPMTTNIAIAIAPSAEAR